MAHFRISATLTDLQADQSSIADANDAEEGRMLMQKSWSNAKTNTERGKGFLAACNLEKVRLPGAPPASAYVGGRNSLHCYIVRT
eukprot:9491317-Pyramimonas_sp.AAC.3